jgi:hypothetical protein
MADSDLAAGLKSYGYPPVQPNWGERHLCACSWSLPPC